MLTPWQHDQGMAHTARLSRLDCAAIRRFRAGPSRASKLGMLDVLCPLRDNRRAVLLAIVLSGCGGRVESVALGPEALGLVQDLDAVAPTAGGAAVDASTQGAPSSACDLPPAVLQSLLNRWNQADKALVLAIDFRWSPCDQFPHPTFKFGTEEAYGEFATVLLLFFEQGDDFAFLADNHLFGVPLLYVFPSGNIGMNTTFRKLAADFSSPTGFGNQSQATRQALAGFLVQIP